MKKISVYPRDSGIASSSYYRIIQYFSRMPEYNVKIRIFVPKWLTQAVYNSRSNLKGKLTKLLYHIFVFFSSIFWLIIDNISIPDSVVILRSAEPKTFVFPVSSLYKRLIKKAGRVIWDFDDDIFVNHEISQKEADCLCSGAKTIVVTHEHLAQLLPEEYRSKVTLMPTTDGDFSFVEPAAQTEKRAETYESDFRIAWLASSAGLEDIRSIAPQLDEAAKKLMDSFGRKMTLAVICNREVEYEFKSLRMEYIKWSRDGAVKEILRSHIGIMPLQNTVFSLGKGGFKIIQYMAAALPSIGSAVGFNKRVIQDGKTGFLVDSDHPEQWIDALIKLSTDMELWKSMSIKSFERWKNEFDYDVNLKKWKEMLD